MSLTSNTNIASSPSPLWLYSYIKLRFFTRIRRFLRAKASARKRSPPSDAVDQHFVVSIIQEPDQLTEHQNSVIDNREGSDDDVATGLQRAVKRLHFGGWPEKEAAAVEIEALAKDDVRVRKLMAELGVVPVLVAMAGSDVVPRRRTAVAALIQLANGTYTNKAVMVEAGILSKLPSDTNDVDEATRHGFCELLLTLSSLTNTPFPLTASNIVPFLVSLLHSTTTRVDTKHSCLATLYNLSTVLDNATILVSNNVIDTLLSLQKDLYEKALATVANLVVTPMGKQAMESSVMVPESLIEALTWHENPKCQECSAYILMILAHQSSAQRQKMSKSGIVGVLLEVALLGSPLAQKRALKLLQWFRDEKMGPHSGPQRMASGSPIPNGRETREGKRMMKSLVKQSLQKNMEMISRRANKAASSDESCKLKALVLSTSSKSLPY